MHTGFLSVRPTNHSCLLSGKFDMIIFGPFTDHWSNIVPTAVTVWTFFHQQILFFFKFFCLTVIKDHVIRQLLNQEPKHIFFKHILYFVHNNNNFAITEAKTGVGGVWTMDNDFWMALRRFWLTILQLRRSSSTLCVTVWPGLGTLWIDKGNF